MKVHRKPARAHARSRLSKKQVAALVDKMGRRQEEILKGEESLRENRAELMKVGRLDLAKEFLFAPVLLQDLANFLWLDQALVSISNSAELAAPPAPATNFPKTFELDRAAIRFDSETIGNRAPEILQALHAKFRSDLRDRLKATHKRQSKAFDRTDELKEWAIQFSFLFPFEEWTCVFPIAALAKDFDFIRRINEAYEQKLWPRLDAENSLIVLAWHGFEIFGVAHKSPPLKRWSDQAACEFVNLMTDGKLKINAYQQRKSSLSYYSQNPKLVTYAEISQDGTHLSCQR